MDARRQIQAIGGTCDDWGVFPEEDDWYWDSVEKILGSRAMPINEINLRRLDIGDDELHFLKQLPELCALYLSYTDVTDEILVPVINNAPDLVHLELDGSLAGDGTGNAVSKRYMRRLDMCQTNVSTEMAEEITFGNPKLSEEFRQHLKLLSRFFTIGDFGEGGVPWLRVSCDAERLSTARLDGALEVALDAIAEYTSSCSVKGDISPDVISAVSVLNPETLRMENGDCGNMSWIPDLKELRKLCLVKSTITELQVPDGLKELEIDGTNLKSAELNRLPNSVTTLKCVCVGWDDADLENLDSMVQLRSLDLSGNAITDDGVAKLKHLRQIRDLFLGDTQITDEAVFHLVDFPKLEFLGLSGTKITGKHFARLAELPKLEALLLFSMTLSKKSLKAVSHLDLSFHDTKFVP